MSVTTTVDDLTMDAMEYLERFMTYETADADSCLTGPGSRTVYDLDLDTGGIVNTEHTAMIVYDEPELSDVYRPIEELDVPCVSVDVVTYDGFQDGNTEFALFETEAGSQSGIQMKYCETVSEVYGIDLLDHPEIVHMNAKNCWPIRVDSVVDDDDTYILVAPIALEYPIVAESVYGDEH